MNINYFLKYFYIQIILYRIYEHFSMFLINQPHLIDMFKQSFLLNIIMLILIIIT